MSVAAMPGRAPRVAIGADQAAHLFAFKWDRHHARAHLPGQRKSLRRCRGGDPERRMRALRWAGQGRDIAEAVELAVRRHVFLLQQKFDLCNALIEAPPALVEAHAELRELMWQECACESHFEPTTADAVQHADLACK